MERAITAARLGGSLVFIGLGTLLLLGNLHYLQWGGWICCCRSAGFCWWVWGLDVAFGHNSVLPGAPFYALAWAFSSCAASFGLAMVVRSPPPAKIGNFSPISDGANLF